MTGAILPPSSKRHRRIAARAHSIGDLRLAARKRLPRGVFDFVAGGAEDEQTLRGNRDAYGLFRFKPNVMVDVSVIDTTAPVLGVPAALPIAIGPTGAGGFSWPCGELAVSGAAARAGIPFALSTSASVSIEDIAAASSGRLWFQCYILKQREYVLRLIERARAAGYEALMITADFPVGGNRERDFRNVFSVPFRYTRRNLLDFARHPRWALATLYHGTPTLANLAGLTGAQPMAQAASSVGRNYDSAFAWDDLRRIRDVWQGKLVVKGVARAQDALRLIDIGVDAIVVSNHGGRQLDGALPTLLCLSSIAAAVRGRVPVMVDGGIRRGTDIVKALALGADTVLLGRAVIYGIAAAGPAGAERSLDILRQELVRTMQLCGVPAVGCITPDLIAAEDIRRQLEPETAAWLLDGWRTPRLPMSAEEPQRSGR